MLLSIIRLSIDFGRKCKLIILKLGNEKKFIL